MITTRIFTGFRRSVHRVTWRDFWHHLERRTSGLVIVESIRVLGPSFNSQVLLKIAGSHIGCNLFGLYLLFYCMDSSHIWYRWKGIFKENPTPYVRRTRITSYGKRRQLPKLRHSDHSRDIGGYQIRTPPFWTSPLLPRMFSFSLAPIWVRFGSFWTRNMTFTSRIVRV